VFEVPRILRLLHLRLLLCPPSSDKVTMGDLDSFFSPETLRILDGICNHHDPLLQPNDDLGGDEGVTSDPRSTKTTNQRCYSHACDIPGYMTLDFTDRKGKRKRANFDDASGAKVAGVRKKGACMRCRLLKIPVSVKLSTAARGLIIVMQVLWGMAVPVLPSQPSFLPWA